LALAALSLGVAALRAAGFLAVGVALPPPRLDRGSSSESELDESESLELELELLEPLAA
jgi:hypothetical protein